MTDVRDEILIMVFVYGKFLSGKLGRMLTRWLTNVLIESAVNIVMIGVRVSHVSSAEIGPIGVKLLLRWRH